MFAFYFQGSFRGFLFIQGIIYFGWIIFFLQWFLTLISVWFPLGRSLFVNIIMLSNILIQLSKSSLSLFSYLAQSYNILSQTVAIYVILKAALIPERSLLELISVDLEDMYNQLYTWLESGSVYLLNHLTPLSSIKKYSF